jgi:hypothetical protein
MMVRCNPEMLLALGLHGRIDHDLDQLWQELEALLAIRSSSSGGKEK